LAVSIFEKSLAAATFVAHSGQAARLLAWLRHRLAVVLLRAKPSSRCRCKSRLFLMMATSVESDAIEILTICLLWNALFSSALIPVSAPGDQPSLDSVVEGQLLSAAISHFRIVEVHVAVLVRMSLPP